MERGPALPTSVPGSRWRLAVLRGAGVGLLIALAGADAVAVAMGPDGEIGRQAGEISRHGGVVGSVTVAAVDGDSSIHPDGKGRFRWVSTLDLRLPRIPRYGRYHPVLHGTSAAALGLAGAVAIWRLSIYPATLTSWLMWPVTMVLPWLASVGAVRSLRSVKAQRKILPTVPTTVVDQVPRQ